MRYTFIRIRRKPLTTAAILVFAIVISLALCGLHSGTLAAQAHYDEVYQTIKIPCTVTNLAGDQSDNLEIYPGEISQFTGDWRGNPTPLMELLEDIQIKGSIKIHWNGGEYTLAGITSLQADARLWPENGCTIFWNEGADASIFAGSELQCILPAALFQDMQQKAAEAAQSFAEAEESAGETHGEAAVTAFPLHLDARFQGAQDFDGELAIMGTYQGVNETTIYCSWNTYASLVKYIGATETADSISATLRDNQNLPLLRELASEWFAEPDVHAAGMDTIGNYAHALDINDSQLQQAKQDLENSMTVNRIAAILVFVLSAGAGALIGFLMIRSRKREIALMRIMGASNAGIYAACAFEQMVCILFGTALGGAYFAWQPIHHLCLFLAVYFVGLSAALWVFLGKNLLASIKEDE